MDQSRPRDQARYEALIIERPDLEHPGRRGFALLFTAIAWLFWLGMWLPLLAAIVRHAGLAAPDIIFPAHISLDSFLALAEIVPWAVGAAIAIVFVAFLREKLGRHPPRDVGFVGMERLATGAALDPKLLAEWQKARILYVEHGPLGRVTNAHRNPPEGPRPG
jgi:poly-beta-1,6-N-acetyl-D-glucosamine biosynthesis protein PgaD